MTADKMDRHTLVVKSADGDFLRDMIGFAAQRLMELDNPLVRLELVGDVLERTGIAQ